MIFTDIKGYEEMKGTLYLCATPIGNLEDMTFRAVRILKEADLIAAEDTRNSIRLLNHFEIKTPMTSYHEHNKVEKGEYLIRLLQEGSSIALITDAGTPGISDPGEALVSRCIELGIKVTAVPGASALITAVICSGKSARRFAFEGFLPADKNERAQVLAGLKEEFRTMILYEAPHRLKRTLEELAAVLGDRPVTLCRELTKKFETILPTTLTAAVALYEEQEPRGEYVLVIAGRDKKEALLEQQRQWEEIPLEAHLQQYLDQGMDKKEAMKQVAKDRGITKRQVYQQLLEHIQ